MRKFISGLILGAGASQRFGQPKQLLPFGGTTLLGWVVAQAERASGLDELVVVLGRAADQIRERVDFGAMRVVENPVFGEGCASSYRAGIAALNPQSQAIMHGDKAAWKLVDANPDLVQEIQFDLPFPDDINTRGDFERIAAAGESTRSN